MTNRTDRPGRYDVVVIGGGAAGLSGALSLARARRSVLVIDAGEPRNAPAGHVRSFFTRDGTPPAELLDAGRAEVRRYGAEVLTGRAVSAAPAEGGGFTVELADRTTVWARRLLLAVGVVDELPDVPGVRELWGRDVLHCPYCHGWEVRDQAIGVLASGPAAMHQALLFGQWTADVTLFLHTMPEPTEDELEQLAARNVRVVRGAVTELVRVDGRLTGVRLASGEVLPRQAVVVGPRAVARPELLVPLGLTAVEHSRGMGEYVPADPTGQTDVPGVWVAGNATELTAQVIAAAASGNLAGAAINADLITEEVRHAVDARRQPFSPAAESRVAEQLTGARRHGFVPAVAK
ncbi:MAG TPA: NAD(P)/FAD-dependent oxidoreductase [Pseudonocardiaceae bacterium]|jgi:thioredoxin reductase|nr:NAD(P)/FAD-dependent oxidoreductase [Pseudonocardiaceae bacterium]